MVNEVRQRIIEKMRAENIVLVQFCPYTEEDYLQEHEGEKDVQEYGDYRDEHCPYVIWFDKYNSGEDLCVMSVSFMDGEHPYFVLHCEGEYDGKDICDCGVARLTMLNVYEMLAKHLELEDEPEKVWCCLTRVCTTMNCRAVASWCSRVRTKLERSSRSLSARAVRLPRRTVGRLAVIVMTSSRLIPTSHETVELCETTFSESVWCHN